MPSEEAATPPPERYSALWPLFCARIGAIGGHSTDYLQWMIVFDGAAQFLPRCAGCIFHAASSLS